MKNTGPQPQESKPKVIVIMPAYNAARTLRITYDAIPKDNIDHVILVDDGSKDETLKITLIINTTLRCFLNWWVPSQPVTLTWCWGRGS